MKCWKCGKEMSREDGGPEIKGSAVFFKAEDDTEATIAYNNVQLGKYSDGKGECHVAICYECYIDNLFGVNESA